MKNLLWVDCIAAALGGVAVLALSAWLSRLYALPRGLLLLTGTVNLAYGCYSLALATRSRRPRSLITLLVCANLAWAVVCLALATRFAGTATLPGMAHLLGEGIFVGALASLEWRWRELLLQA